VRQALLQKPRGAPRSKSVSLPPPIGGLNARDSVANMEPEDALVLDNWFPRTTDVAVRNGYTAHCTFTGNCETVVVYTGHAATKIFVAVNTTNDLIIDATTAGAISTAVVGSSGPTVQAITNSRWDYVNYGTAGGMFLLMVNGVDTALEYDGTTWSTATLTHADLAGTDDLFTNAVYAERIWYGEKNTFNVYYLPVRTKSGAMTKLNVGSFFKLGGSLNSIVTVTDAADALTDYIAFVSTEGEVIAYAGTDPATPADWVRAAHFRIGRPVCKGQRAWCKFGADALITCADGIVSLRRAIASDRAENASSISDKIRDLINADVAVHGTRFGWQIEVHPTGSKLICNVPTLENSTSRQYVMNTQTGAWCRYTGWDAFCFGVAKDTLYMGGAGILVIADSGSEDGGDSISTDCRQAFNYFGARGQTKQLSLMRPILSITGAAEVAVGVDTDYGANATLALQTIQGGAGDPWGGVWSAAWAQAAAVYRSWFGVAGEGFALAPRLKTITDGVEVTWSATDVVYEAGGRL
jgi:hypothetical protein